MIDTDSSRPYRLHVPDADLAELRTRLMRTRWPKVDLTDVGWDQGVPLGYLRELTEYWHTAYEWREHEAWLNRFAQFITVIDGTTVHYLHVRSAEPHALPLIMTHGWPGSVVELLGVIGPLIDPAAHGGDPDDAFHLVAPSIPGFGLSGPTRQPGWDVDRIAAAWATLMARLGYGRYGAQGGDWGSRISWELGRRDPDHVAGVHVTMLVPTPPQDEAELAALREQDRARLDQLAHFRSELSGYMKLQATKPQTLAHRPRHARRPGWPSWARTLCGRSGVLLSATTPSCIGRSSTVAATSQRWNNPGSSLRTSDASSAGSADLESSTIRAVVADGCPRWHGSSDVSGERRHKGAPTQEGIMKYMIMLYGSQQDYDVLAGKPTSKAAMSDEDIAAMHAHMESIAKDLVDSGEWVDARGMTAPVHARRVHLSNRVPVVTDGPYAETEEVLAGYTIVECGSFDRATEIAARYINPDAPGEYVDVRPILEDVSELSG